STGAGQSGGAVGLRLPLAPVGGGSGLGGGPAVTHRSPPSPPFPRCPDSRGRRDAAEPIGIEKSLGKLFLALWFRYHCAGALGAVSWAGRAGLSAVSVLYFARSAELAGLRCETLSVPREITSLQLWEEIVKVHPRLAVIRDQVVFAVRQEYVLLGDQVLVLQPGDECDMEESEDVPKDFIKLKSEKLSVDEVSELVVSPSCGAVSLFIGTTRNNFKGRKVIHLEYEAYSSMAETEIKKICRDVRQKWPSVKHIAMYHRVGYSTERVAVMRAAFRLRFLPMDCVKESYYRGMIGSVVPITEASVIIAVSSPHRTESLEAVTYCINTLKASVPIWKKVCLGTKSNLGLY
ncbi:Molybdopterin synthase catalytic subunit, partial [Lamprotornis superbus]